MRARPHSYTVSRVLCLFAGLGDYTEVLLSSSFPDPSDLRVPYHAGLVPPLLLEAPKRATKLYASAFLPGRVPRLIPLERFKRLLGQDLPRTLRRKEDDPTAFRRDGLCRGVRVVPTTKVGPHVSELSAVFQSHRVLRRRSVRAGQNQVRRHRSRGISLILYRFPRFRLQDKSSTFAGPMDVLKTIIRKEGVLGLYAGMESTFWRHFWWNGGYFGSIFQVKALLPKPTVGPRGSPHLRLNFTLRAHIG